MCRRIEFCCYLYGHAANAEMRRTYGYTMAYPHGIGNGGQDRRIKTLVMFKISIGYQDGPDGGGGVSKTNEGSYLYG